ncbi:MAG: hypothetical protein ABJZ55_04365 [Fuerstiella sp.]
MQRFLIVFVYFLCGMLFSAMAVTVAMWLITLGLCKAVLWIAPNSPLPSKVFMLHICLVLPCSLIAAFVGGITMGSRAAQASRNIDRGIKQGATRNGRSGG